MPSPPIRILFVCAENACQSQMAEGLLRHLGGQRFVARSAGVRPMHLDPLATRALQEIHVEISRQRGKNIAVVLHERFDLVVTLCDESEESCPPVPRGAARRHRSFDDPSWLEDADGNPDLDEYRRIRDELGAFIRELVAELA